MGNHPPIQDEFTDLPISPQLKAYRRRLRDRKCVDCGGSRGRSPHARCAACTKRRNAKRRAAWAKRTTVPTNEPMPEPMPEPMEVEVTPA